MQDIERTGLLTGQVSRMSLPCVMDPNRFNIILAELCQTSLNYADGFHETIMTSPTNHSITDQNHSINDQNHSIANHRHSIHRPQLVNLQPVPSIVETRPLYLTPSGSYALLVQNPLSLTLSTHAVPRRSIQAYGSDQPTDEGYKEERRERERPSDLRLKSFLYYSPIAYYSLASAFIKNATSTGA